MTLTSDKLPIQFHFPFPPGFHGIPPHHVLLDKFQTILPYVVGSLMTKKKKKKKKENYTQHQSLYMMMILELVKKSGGFYK